MSILGQRSARPAQGHRSICGGECSSWLGKDSTSHLGRWRPRNELDGPVDASVLQQDVQRLARACNCTKATVHSQAQPAEISQIAYLSRRPRSPWTRRIYHHRAPTSSGRLQNKASSADFRTSSGLKAQAVLCHPKTTALRGNCMVCVCTRTFQASMTLRQLQPSCPNSLTGTLAACLCEPQTLAFGAAKLARVVGT